MIHIFYRPRRPSAGAVLSGINFTPNGFSVIIFADTMRISTASTYAAFTDGIQRRLALAACAAARFFTNMMTLMSQVGVDYHEMQKDLFSSFCRQIPAQVKVSFDGVRIDLHFSSCPVRFGNHQKQASQTYRLCLLDRLHYSGSCYPTFQEKTHRKQFRAASMIGGLQRRFSETFRKEADEMNLTPDMERKNQRTLDIALLAFMTLIYLCGLAASVLRLFQVIPGAAPGLLTWGLLTAGFSLCLCGLIRCIQGKEEKLTPKTALRIEYPCLILAALFAVMQHLDGQTLSRRKIAVLVGLVLLVLFHAVKYFSSKKSNSDSTPPV